MKRKPLLTIDDTTERPTHNHVLCLFLKLFTIDQTESSPQSDENQFEIKSRYNQAAEAQINISYVKKIFCMRDKFVDIKSIKKSV